MASLSQILKDDRHPSWLLDAVILSAAVYKKDPKQEVQEMNTKYGLPSTVQYEFLPDHELDNARLSSCKQTLLVVKSLALGHYIVACRGTQDIGDALVDLKIMQRTMSLGDGAAHAGFLDRAKTVPLNYFKKLLVRNEKIVITGHSLGGAVASLLTLRLLESTGKWCHEQMQCYTFGCPFFADYRLASYINTHYKHHFVHLVSGSDFVPRAMPVVYTLYSLWAGLHVGPLEDVLHCSRVLMLCLKVMKMSLKLSQQNFLLGMGSEALQWLPALSRFALHRLLALALSFHSGYGYAFAGRMMLLDPQTSSFEVENREHWTLNAHLTFHLGGVSLDALKEHRLLSYIEHIFAKQRTRVLGHSLAEQQLSDNAAITCSNVIFHTATLDLQDDREQQLGQHVNETFTLDDLLQHDSEDQRIVSTINCKDDLFQHDFKDQRIVSSINCKEKMKGLRAFRSQVACVIFTRRLQEAADKNLRMRKKRRGRIVACVRLVSGSISRFSHMIRHFDKIFLGYSAMCSIYQMRRLICRI